MTTTSEYTTKAPKDVAALLEVKDVSRRFGGIAALDSVSLSIAENEFFALLGPSGCGKTTLLRSIAGFEEPDEGSILLDGQDLLGQPPNRRPVNLMFQSYALFPHLSVERNVAYGLERESTPKAEVRRRVGEVLETVGLTSMAKRRPRQLSGGQRQRVALARAIVKQPRLLLLDEPLSALDRKVRAEMQLELKRLQHEVGITFVVVTHDQEEAMSMADRIAVICEGRVQQIAAPHELYQQPSNLFVADFVGTSNRITGLKSGEVFRSPTLGRLACSAEPRHSSSEDTDGSLILRPEDVRLLAHGDASAQLQGAVTDVQFKGGSSQLAVEVDGHAGPFLVAVAEATTIGRGDRVGLTWDRAVFVTDELR